MEGALYAFPQIHLPPQAVEAAKEEGYASPDTFYCMKLLEATGLCVVPGSGFDQEPNTFHFRCTILPPEEEFESVFDALDKFHSAFMKEFS